MHLRDFCAAIISGITLHNGLTTKDGMVAVYGSGSIVHTLYKEISVHSNSELKSILESHDENFVKSYGSTDGPIAVTVCVPEKSGIKGLVEYLKNRGFKSSHHKHENKAASLYFDKLKVKKMFSIVNPFGKYDIRYIPEMGRELASAITMGQVGLKGDYSCSSRRSNKAPYLLDINTPLDMGILKIKASVVINDMHSKLVFINGKLRILKGMKDSISPNSPLVLEIFPKLDSKGKEEELLRESFEIFLLKYYGTLKSSTSQDIDEHVFLGCDMSMSKYKNSKINEFDTSSGWK